MCSFVADFLQQISDCEALWWVAEVYSGISACWLFVQVLLPMLVNKLGDPDHKIASKASYLLLKLGEPPAPAPAPGVPITMKTRRNVLEERV